MTDHTIDLRNKVTGAEEGTMEGKAPTGSRRNEAALEWSAHEYTKKDRSTAWHVIIGAAALALAVVGIVTKSYFFIAFVALAYGTFLMYERRSPAEISFSISDKGVRVGKTAYRFSELKSFWIFKGTEPEELSLHTERTLLPYIRVPLKNVDADKVRTTLKKFLPEEEHQEFISDHIDRIV